MKAALFVVTLCALFLAGCTPATWNLAQKSYKEGDIVSAMTYSAQTLREKPNYGAAVLFLSENLARTYDDLLQKAKQAENAKNYEEAHALYLKVKAVSDAVSSVPPQTDPTTKTQVSFPTKDVSAETESAAQAAAEKNYQKGVAFESSGKPKDAAKAYTEAMKYVAGYKDAQTRYDKCRVAAVKRVAVMPFDNTSGKSKYGAIGDNLASQMIAQAMADPANLEFLEFVSRERLDQLVAEQKLGQTGMLDQSTAASMGKVLGIHAFVFGKITSVVPDFPQNVTARTVEERTISLGENQTMKVSAVVQTTTRKGAVKLTATYQIIDVERATIVKAGSCTQDASQEVKWARFTGDERALSSSTRSLCSQDERSLPPEEELANQAVDRTSKSLAREIAAFFK